MSAEHKRPLLAFALVAIACMLILANALRTEAVRGYLEDGAHRVVAGVELALDHPIPPQPVVAPPGAAAPFDRLKAAGAQAHPTPAPTAPSASSATIGPAAPSLPSAAAATPIPASVPDELAPVTTSLRRPGPTVRRAAHLAGHTVHRAPHRAGHIVHRAPHRAGHVVRRATQLVVHRAAQLVVQRSADAGTLPGALGHQRAHGHQRALGHRTEHGGARVVLPQAAHRARPARPSPGQHGQHGQHGRGHHGGARGHGHGHGHSHR